MIDATGDVRRTFNDYRNEDGMSFVKLKVGAGHPFAGRRLADIGSATNMPVVLCCAMARTRCCPMAIP